ncbi:tetratricopeptide repeat protein [Niabella sp. 22666]|uniref:tetratricopeptide repeat protein n=1 Tax=Niabella sp. 22666 TaxID=3453954 RepID=UPI003F83C906
MKKVIWQFLFFSLVIPAFAQKPSKEQMEKDRKAYAEAQKKLNEQLSKMSPEARRMYDSMTGSVGMGQKIKDAESKINNNPATVKNGIISNGIIPVKNSKGIGSIAATPSTANMSTFIGTTSNSTFSAVLPAAKNKANDIYKALKNKNADTNEMGSAATVLWMQGRIQIALSLMAQVCKDDAGNTDNLNNYAAMLTMMGAPELAIPILNNLNARFKKNSTILNNLGQAWFALGDMGQSKKYLDSTLMIAAAHAQANETLCFIEENKGNKTAATSHAKTAFKQGATAARKDKLAQLGYKIGLGDYNNFPPANKSDDLLNLGNFSPMEFPKSYAAMKAYEEQRKQFLVEISQAMQPLQKLAEESNKEMVKRLQDQQKQFMNASSKALANPGSVSQSSALQIVGAPMFSEEMNARENRVLQNLQRKKDAVLQNMAAFMKGDGAVYKKEYEAAMNKINERWKNVGQGGTENNEVLCSESVKTVDTYLASYNTKYEDLYNEYLIVQKQFLNEMAYVSLYTTYPELLPGIIAGLKKQWLSDLSFKAEVLGVTYGCTGAGKIKGGKLTAFKDPNCTINSDFGAQLGIVNVGFNIHLDCSGLKTSINAAALGLTLNQDLDHAGFGDSFKSCTVSIGPKASVGGKVGPLQANVSAGVGADIEIDRNGISDVVVKGGVEAEAGIGPASGSAGAEVSISLNTGAGSVQGTGIFGK